MGSKSSKRDAEFDFDFDDDTFKSLAHENLKSWLASLHRLRKTENISLPSHHVSCQVYNLSTMLQRDFQTILTHSLRNMLQAMLRCCQEPKRAVDMALATNDALNVYICILELMYSRFSSSTMMENIHQLRNSANFLSSVRNEFDSLFKAVDGVLMCGGFNADPQSPQNCRLSLFAPLQDWVSRLSKCLRLVRAALFENEEARSERAHRTLLQYLPELICSARDQLTLLSKIIDALPTPPSSPTSWISTEMDDELLNRDLKHQHPPVISLPRGILRKSQITKSPHSVKFHDGAVKGTFSAAGEEKHTYSKSTECCAHRELLHVRQIRRSECSVASTTDVDQAGDRIPFATTCQFGERDGKMNPSNLEGLSGYVKLQRTSPCAPEKVFSVLVCCEN